jgi:hypothetical protein
MSLLTRSEIKRDATETLEYERDVEAGYDGTFAEWLAARLGTAATEPPDEDLSVPDEDIAF